MFPSIQVQLTGPLPNLLDPSVTGGQESLQSSHSLEYASSDINLDFEENSPFQEGVISEAYQMTGTCFSFKNLKN